MRCVQCASKSFDKQSLWMEGDRFDWCDIPFVGSPQLLRKGNVMRVHLFDHKVVLPLISIALFVAFQTPHLRADSHGDKFVYVMTNKNPQNSVIQYSRMSNGSLVWLREVATGGKGTGPNGADPLGSQDSLILTGDGHFLLAANA